MAIFEPTWSATAAYSVGDRVTFNGVIYTNLVAVPTGTSNAIPFDNTSWEVSHVVRILDYYSLIETVRLQLKQVADPETNRSIPYFIQQAELSFQRSIRVPEMQRLALITSGSDGRLRIPSDMLEPINLRRNSNTAINQRNISIRYTGDSYEEWVGRQFTDVAETSIDAEGDRIVASPVYRIEGNDIVIAPTPEAAIEYELVYYGSFPQLGTVANLVNSVGQPVNDAGQTETEITDGTTFVQATEAITTNYYTQAAPDLLLNGALYQAYLWLKETEKAQVALNDFQRIKQEIEEQVEDFLTSSPQDLSLQNGNYQT